MEDATVPVSLEPMQTRQEPCDKRLWIGNLDNRVNEYQLLKMVRAYGYIEKFDMLFHRTGPQAGQSRGFAFVTYKLKQDAMKAMASLNGVQLGNRRMCVKFAKNAPDEYEKSKPELEIPALAGLKSETKVSNKIAIQCIEAKLKMMENTQPGDDFVVDRLLADETPVITQYQHKLMQKQKPVSSFRRRHPYHKKR